MDYLISGVPFDDLDLDHFNVIGDNEAFQFYKQFFWYTPKITGQCKRPMSLLHVNEV